MTNLNLPEILQPKPALELITVMDRGVPNQERIYLKAHRRVNIGQYLLLVGLPLHERDAVPLKDYLLWFGDRFIESGTWLLVYTGPGRELVTFMQDTKEPALILHWGKQVTVFQNNELVPCLVRIDYSPGGVQIGKKGL